MDYKLESKVLDIEEGLTIPRIEIRVCETFPNLSVGKIFNNGNFRWLRSFRPLSDSRSAFLRLIDSYSTGMDIPVYADEVSRERLGI
jgi:hypothetical protein